MDRQGLPKEDDKEAGGTWNCGLGEERETGKEPEKFEGLKATLTRGAWAWLSGKGRKMDLIRSACNSVDVGGLELAVQKT